MRTEYRKSFAGMGTQFELILRGEDVQHLEAVASAICEEIGRLDATLSRFNPGSEIARINRTAASGPVKVDREVFALLILCQQAREKTNGYFDLAAASGGAEILLDADECSVLFSNSQIQLDLGGIGKGYALDCAADLMKRFQIEEALLSAGSSSVLARGGPWNIAFRNPRISGSPVGNTELTNAAVSCSAARHPDQEVSDVFDPKSGQPVTVNDGCAVVTESATEAEIYSTALLAMGREDAAIFLRERGKSGLKVEWY